MRYKAHDEKNECSIGDTVRLAETRPLSKEKRWRVVEIVTRAEQVEVRPQEIEPRLEETQAEPGEISADQDQAE